MADHCWKVLLTIGGQYASLLISVDYITVLTNFDLIVASVIVFKNQKISIERFDSGIYHLKTADGADIEMDDVRELRDFFIKRNDLKPGPVLFEAGEHSLGNPEVREYMSNASRFFTADAFLIKDFSHKLVYRFYLRFYKPETPTGLFTDRKEAMEWLEQFVAND